MNKATLFLSLLLFLFSINLSYSQEADSTVDKRVQHIDKLQGEEKLEALFQQIDENDYNTTNNLIHINALELEAKAQSNYLWLARTYHIKLWYYDTHNNRDSVLFYANLGNKKLELFKKHTPKPNKEQNELYQSLASKFLGCMVDSYLQYNKYDLALLYIKRTLNEGNIEEGSAFECEIYYQLGVVYLHAKKGQESLDSFKKAYSIYQNETNRKPPYGYVRFLFGMMHALNRLKDYDQILVLSDSIEKLIEDEHNRIGDKSYAYYYLTKFILKNQTAYILTQKGELVSAKKHLDQATEIMEKFPMNNVFLCSHYQISAEYYSAIGKHKEAKRLINLSLECNKEKRPDNSIYNYLKHNLIRANILNKGGENQEAYNLLHKLYHLNDSINSSSFSSQIAEIETLYNLDKIKLESEQDKMRLKITRYILIMSVFIVLLLIYIIYSVLKNSKILKEKNRQLFSQYSKL